MILRRLGMRLESRGMRPAQGLVCSNHLSYLDILVYAAAMPCVFVSKREVLRWPVFGWLARCGGTIFLDRQSRASAEQVTRQMAAALETGVPVLLFPEGTSTDGSAVLRFHPTLLEAAVQLHTEMTAAAISYRVRGGEERAMCWYGDAPFTPHLLQTLGRTGVVAEVEFFPERDAHADRKSAALELHDKVEAMRKRMVRAPAE
jgi:1-acyl-sn-glycerol-3-phosphate acyltransferase